MFLGNTLALSGIARKKNGDGMKRWTGEAANPPVGMIPPGIAKHFRARDHALLEFLGKRCE